MRNWGASFVITAVVLVSVLEVSSCTTVQISGAESASVYWGVLRVIPSKTAGITVVRTNGYGVVPSSEGLTVGFAKETLALINDTNKCAAIFFISDNDQAKSVIKQIKDSGFDTKRVCITTDGAEK